MLKSYFESPKKISILVAVFGVAMACTGTTDSLDIRYYYDQTTATLFLHSLTAQELQSYIRNEWIDFGFMFAYSLLFVSLLKKVFSEASQQNGGVSPASRRNGGVSLIPNLKWLGLLPGLVDVVENSCILNLLYHLDSLEVPKWLGLVTNMKWNTGILVVGIIIIGAVRRINKA